MDHGLRRDALRRKLDAIGVDALLVTRLSNVRYLTGFTGSNAQCIVGRERDHLFTDGRYDEQASHESPDVPRTIYLDGVPPYVGVATQGVGRLGFEAGFLTWTAWDRLRQTMAEARIELVPTAGSVEDLRRSKEPEEVVLLRDAQEATDIAFDRVIRGGGLREGMTERELAWALERAMREAGADGMAFDPIVAFGESAAEPHHHPSDRTLRPGDVVKTDFGALVAGYHADMTRTVAFGAVAAELRDIRDLVFAAQAAGIAAVRPGASISDIDRAARAVIEDAGRGPNFPHGLGHGVGLDIHEDPFIRRVSDEVLPVGAVVTVEPGVYVPGLGGVRIEDSVEVTADGGRPLPRSDKEFLLT